MFLPTRHCSASPGQRENIRRSWTGPVGPTGRSKPPHHCHLTTASYQILVERSTDDRTWPDARPIGTRGVPATTTVFTVDEELALDATATPAWFVVGGEEGVLANCRARFSTAGRPSTAIRARPASNRRWTGSGGVDTATRERNRQSSQPAGIFGGEDGLTVALAATSRPSSRTRSSSPGSVISGPSNLS